MPIVFVHGVNVRKDEEGRYTRAEQRRDAFFKECVLTSIAADPKRLVVYNPYWGGHAATFPWDHGALPEAEYETFGAEAGLEATELLPALSLAGVLGEGEAPPPANGVLPWLARRGIEAATDFLVLTATDPSIDEFVDADAVARLARAVGAYAFVHRDAPPSWLDQVATNEAFIDRLAAEVQAWGAGAVPAGAETRWESFGAGDQAWRSLRDTAGRIRRAAVKLERGQFRSRVRDPLHKNLAQFLGDTFVYLNERGTAEAPGPIVQDVIEALEAADAQRRGTPEPLIVVAHSMGGNIMYDVLTYFRPSINVDYFVTVGSQVALFEELKLFKISDATIPNGIKQVSKPRNVQRWLNVFDHHDVLGFVTGKVFADTTDVEYTTGSWLFGAHGAYFTQPSFHHRLAARVQEGRV